VNKAWLELLFESHKPIPHEKRSNRRSNHAWPWILEVLFEFSMSMRRRSAIKFKQNFYPC